MVSKDREMLKAQALGDVQAADAIDGQLSDDERERYYVLTLALFVGAVGHRLGDGPTREAIDAFVNEMRYDYRNAEPKVNFLVVEALVRAVFGEDQLIDDISPKDQYLAQLPAIRKIVAQSEHMKARLDDYLTEAEALAAEWMAADD